MLVSYSWSYLLPPSPLLVVKFICSCVGGVLVCWCVLSFTSCRSSDLTKVETDDRLTALADVRGRLVHQVEYWHLPPSVRGLLWGAQSAKNWHFIFSNAPLLNWVGPGLLLSEGEGKKNLRKKERNSKRMQWGDELHGWMISPAALANQPQRSKRLPDFLNCGVSSLAFYLPIWFANSFFDSRVTWLPMQEGVRAAETKHWGTQSRNIAYLDDI